MAPQPYNSAPAESFDFKTDMDLSGSGLLWYAAVRPASAIFSVYSVLRLLSWLPSSYQAAQGTRPGVLQHF